MSIHQTETVRAADIETLTQQVLQARPEWHGAQVASTLYGLRDLAPLADLARIALEAAGDPEVRSPAVIRHRLNMRPVVTAPAPTPALPLAALECAECAAPYPAIRQRRAVAGACGSCGVSPLRLITAHYCTKGCRDHD